MTDELAAGGPEELEFRHYSDRLVHATVAGDGPADGAGDLLTARWIRLDDGTRLRQVRVAAGANRDAGYGRLDNEILAGRRLHEVAETENYPASVSFLYGDDADSAAPCALLRPYRGEPLSSVATHMLEEEQQAFVLSLLTGLCWLAAAGIAHRALTPATVRWDREQHAQITVFSGCSVFGAPRSTSGWAGEAGTPQKPGRAASGLVTSRDDIYAAGLLIYYVRSQGDSRRPSASQLSALGLGVMEPVFGPPEQRPTARELLASLGQPGPVPRRASPLEDGYSRFEFWREKKSPGREFPADPRDALARDTSVPVPRPPSPPPSPADAAPVPPQAAPSGDPADRGKRRSWRRAETT